MSALRASSTLASASVGARAMPIEAPTKAWDLGHFEGRGDGADDAVGDDGDVGNGVHIGLNDGEFVAAEPGDGIGFAEQGTHAAGHLADQIVAGLVPERVVDLLEAVEVDYQQGNAVGPAPRRGDGGIEPILEQGAIGQTRQLVVEGHVLGRGPARLDLAGRAPQPVDQGHDDGEGHDKAGEHGRHAVRENAAHRAGQVARRNW